MSAQVIPFPERAPRPFEYDPLGATVTAADAVLLALGEDGAVSALSGLCGAALTEHEQEVVRPLADALRWLIGGEGPLVPEGCAPC